MAELVTLEQHMEAEPPTVAIQATGLLWEAVFALVNLQEGGLGVHLSVKVATLYTKSCCKYYYYVCIA